MAKSLGIKLPLILDVVEDDDMIETIRAGKHMIIAIPIEDVQTQKEERMSNDTTNCPQCGKENDLLIFSHWGCGWCGFEHPQSSGETAK